MLGYGVDITEIHRIKNIIDKHETFLTRYFSEQERSYMQKNPERIAGNFCAKEAFSKAIGTGIRDFNLKEIEILRDELGKPYISLSKKLEQFCHELGYSHFQVSISHCKEYAMAGVIASKTSL